MASLLLLRGIISQSSGRIKNGEFSDAAAQSSTPYLMPEFSEESRDEISSFDSTLWEDIASEDLAAPINFASSRPPESTRNDLKRKAATSNHKGVHFKTRNKKFVSRLCLPGGKSRKLELGEYNTHDEAARAYQVGAFYYNKSSISNSEEDHSFLETLPCVPDNLSDEGKLAWVRDRARHSAASIGTSGTRGKYSSKHVLESGGNSFDARPGTPASYGTQGSCDDYHSTPTTPTTTTPNISRSAYTDNFLWFPGANEVRASTNDFVDEMDDKRKRLRRIAALRKIRESKRQNSVQTQSQGSPNVELQQGRNSSALTDQALVIDHPGVSQVKFTDSILFALVELRKQGWEWTLKLRSPSSVETGVLFSVPRGQHVAPALCITDIITNSFHELREQGWEVHLQPHEGGHVELIREVCVAPTGCAAQDKMKASKFSAQSLQIGSWLHSSAFGVEVRVKFSYTKQKLVWELPESGRRRKMEILWSEIDDVKTTYADIGSDTLEIYVSSPPSCFMGPTPQSRWVACTDFTGGQASMCMSHLLEFPPGVLKEHYEKLVQCDPGLEKLTHFLNSISQFE